MSALGLLGLFIVVTGLIWLLQLLLKNRVDVTISIHQTPPPTAPTGEKSRSVNADEWSGVLGSVLTPYVPSPRPPAVSESIGDQPLLTRAMTDDPTDPDDPTEREEPVYFTDPLGMSQPDLNDQPGQEADEADYMYEHVVDEEDEELPTLETLTESIPTGKVTLVSSAVKTNPFKAVDIAQQDITSASSPEPYDSLYAKIQAAARHVEQQMLALNRLQRDLLDQQRDLDARRTADPAWLSTEAAPGESMTGTGLLAAIGSYAVGESSAEPYQSTLPMEGTGSQDFETESLDQAQLDAYDTDRGVPIAGYFQTISLASELSHEFVESILTNAPRQEVKRRGRQILKAIRQYSLGNDANAVLAVTAQMNRLPELTAGFIRN